MLTEQQQLAVDRVDCNILVSAGAGSGKTHVLVERYVEILRRNPDCTLANILAVTFTRKAASEMRSRLKARFLNLSQQETAESGDIHVSPGGVQQPSAQRARWHACLAEVDGARIGTIHSLCESILKAYPSDCGIDPQFEVIDELVQNELLDAAIAAAMREVIESQDTSTYEHDVLLDYSIEELKKLLTRLIKSSMQFRQSVAGMGTSLEQMRSNAEKWLRAVKAEALLRLTRNQDFLKMLEIVKASPLVGGDQKNKLLPARQNSLALWSEVLDDGTASDTALDRRWAAFEEVCNYKPGNIGGNAPEAKELRETMGNMRKFGETLVKKIPAGLNEEDERGFAFTLGIIGLFERVSAIYERSKQDLTVLDYNDLIGLALDCLKRDDSMARAFFNEKLHALLVDEFQDTNDIQATLLSLLAGPQTRIFLIGDDKQSIYKFQGADVATFNKWKLRFRSSGEGSGNSLVTKLTRSFRSHPDVVLFVNAVFSRLLDSDPEELPYVAKFEALEAARAASVLAPALAPAAAALSPVSVAALSPASAAALSPGSAAALSLGSAPVLAPGSAPALAPVATSGDAPTRIEGVSKQYLPGFVAAYTTANRSPDYQVSYADEEADEDTDADEGEGEGEDKDKNADQYSVDGEQAYVSESEFEPGYLLAADEEPDDDFDEELNNELDNELDGELDSELDSGAKHGANRDALDLSSFPSALEQPSSSPAVEVIWTDNESSEDGNVLSPESFEAQQVGLWIRNKVESGFRIAAKSGSVRPISYGDCAVLVSRNRDFAAFESYFSHLKIPYVTFGGSGFLRRQEVADFENLFRFLDNPRDGHSLLAVLRSPFCALTDDLIQLVVSEGNKGPLWTVLVDFARKRKQGYESVSLAVGRLRTLLDYAALLPLGELTQKIISKTGYDLAILAAPDGQQRSRNVWKLAHLAREHEHLSCGDFARRLELMRDFGMQESEAPLDSSDAVKLMTVHASKGLEFPIVALPSLNVAINRNSDKLVYHPSYGVSFNTKKLKEEEAPGWYQVASYLDKQMEREERKRLLYVAMTRARDNLGIFLRSNSSRTESYRTWMVNVLSLFDENLTFPSPGQQCTRGVSSIEDGTRAGFSFSFADAREDESELSVQEIDDSLSLSNIDFSLTETMAPAPAEPRVNELSAVRITPSMSALAGGLDSGSFDPATLGSFFHLLMENLPPSGRKVSDDYIRDAVFSLGPSAAHPRIMEALFQEGRHLLDIFFESRLADLLARAGARLHELPYLIRSADGDKMILRRPDLIFEDSQGDYQLIDFKTDHFDPGQVDIQARKHREQVLDYVRDLERLAGRPLKPWLYFAQHGILYPL